MAKIASEYSIAWRFGKEDLVKTKLFINLCKEHGQSFLLLLRILKYLN
jgi:hypothetical protein